MIEITENTIERVSNALDGIPKGAEKVFVKAINSALNMAKNDVYKEVMKEYAISKDVLTKYTRERIKKATNDTSCGEIVFSGKQIPLYKYDPTSPKSPSRHLPVPVIGGQKTATVLTGAFVQTIQNATGKPHTGIFRRTGEVNPETGKTKISELLGSSLRSMANEVVMDEVYANAQKKMNKTIEAEVSRLLEGAGAK